MKVKYLVCFPRILLCFALLTVSKEEDEFIFQDEDSSIELKIHLTRAVSKVINWSVFLNSSSAMLGVDSYVPIEERGFWIVGFKSRSTEEIFAMFTGLGQLKLLETEDRRGYCSNLPYFYNYTITDILQSHSLYQEDTSGNALSIFDWRSRPPYNPVIAADGNMYNKTTLKSMTVTLRQMMNCMNTSEEYDDNSFVFKKTLSHTYVRVKESCVNKFKFDVKQCIDVFERSSVLIWRLSTQILVMSSVASTAREGVAQKHQVTAESYDTKLFRYTTDQGLEMVQTEVTLDLRFISVTEDSYYFYMPDSFNITGPYDLESEALYDWGLMRSPSINMTDLLVYLEVRHNVSLNLANVTSEEFARYISEQTFPLSLLPRSLSGSASFNFKFSVVNELDKLQEKMTVSQQYGYITCTSSSGTGSERQCSFGSSLTTVTTGVTVTVHSETQVYTAKTEMEWTVELMSVSAGDNLVSLLESHRPLYARESLHVQFSVTPFFVLQYSDIRLLYVTLSQQTTKNTTRDHSYIVYLNQQYQDEMPPHLSEFQDRQVDSFGNFSCTVSGTCTLSLVSDVFASSTSGEYELTIAMRLQRRFLNRSKRDTTMVRQPENLGPEAASNRTYELYFKYDDSFSPSRNASSAHRPEMVPVFMLVGFWSCLVNC